MFGVLRTTVLSPRRIFAHNAMVFEHCADSVLRSSFDRLALACFEHDRLALAWFERAAPRGRLEEVLKDRVALPGVELLDP